MDATLLSPAKAAIMGIPGTVLFAVVPILGMAMFAFILYRRIAPLVHAQGDPRLDHTGQRLKNLLKYGVGQYRQPRYMLAGVLHIMIFAGFMILSVRSITLVAMGIRDGFALPGLGGTSGRAYCILKDLASTVVFCAALTAMVRRGIYKPERYSVPPRCGKEHTWEAVMVLALIVALVACDFLFEGSLAANAAPAGVTHAFMLQGTGPWIAAGLLSGLPQEKLQEINLGAYLVHEFVFFFFLCFLPFGKHFHVITSLPNVFFMNLEKGRVKPVRYGVSEDKLDALESFGVKNLEDFTWKHILDFYSCADCGRCSDNCPAKAAGRPLNPRFISIKCRNYTFQKHPMFGAPINGKKLVGDILDESEIWSCTTCGACEQECPLLIQYIDKIVDLRRGLVDGGNVPQSLQKPLSALEKRGNPWGKMEKKRADWAKSISETIPLKRFDEGQTAETLFFVDSISSYDDRMQNIAKAAASILDRCGVDFTILGKNEKDSGNDVRRFGEEMLFQQLKSHNTGYILESGVRRIVTADPHAYNALKNEYNGLPHVEHVSQIIARGIQMGKLRLQPLKSNGKVHAYHDPCYLGRHNGIYDDPRSVLDSIQGLKRVEMLKSRDRSFCCGGGGLMLFYEPEEEQRMGVLRVRMAAEAGAGVIVTACPFCLANIEDAIKVAGLEGKMEAIDLAELVAGQLDA